MVFYPLSGLKIHHGRNLCCLNTTEANPICQSIKSVMNRPAEDHPDNSSPLSDSFGSLVQGEPCGVELQIASQLLDQGGLSRRLRQM